MGTVFWAVAQCSFLAGVGAGRVKLPRATIMAAFIVGKAAKDLLSGFHARV